MPFLTLTNNQNIGNSDFYRDTSTSLKPTKDDPQGIEGFVNQSLLLLSEQLRNITLELHLPGISWFSGANARHAHLCLLLLSGPAREARQKEFEQERLSSFADCLEHFME